MGTTGNVACAQQHLQQLFETNLNIDHVTVPSGSAGIPAGMVTGLVITNAHIPIAGITVSHPEDLQEKIVHHSALLTAEKVGVSQALPRDSIHCFDDQVGPVYSHPTVGMVEEVKLLAQSKPILFAPF